MCESVVIVMPRPACHYRCAPTPSWTAAVVQFLSGDCVIDCGRDDMLWVPALFTEAYRALCMFLVIAITVLAIINTLQALRYVFLLIVASVRKPRTPTPVAVHDKTE